MTGRRAFIVEDEALIMMTLEDMLSDLGWQVTGKAFQIETAIDVARGGQFDVAVLDIHVNGEMIYPVADILQDRGIPFLFATGYGARGINPRYSGHPLIEKPYHERTLDAALTQLVTEGSG